MVGYNEVDRPPVLAPIEVARPRKTKTDRAASLLRAPLPLAATFTVKARALRLDGVNRRLRERFAVARDHTRGAVAKPEPAEVTEDHGRPTWAVSLSRALATEL